MKYTNLLGRAVATIWQVRPDKNSKKIAALVGAFPDKNDLVHQNMNFFTISTDLANMPLEVFSSSQQESLVLNSRNTNLFETELGMFQILTLYTLCAVLARVRSICEAHLQYW